MGKDLVKAGGQPPPAKKSRRYEIVWLPAQGGLDVTIATNEIEGVTTHWIYDERLAKHRSTYCRKPDNCLFCTPDYPAGWCGYLPVWDHNLMRAVVVNLPPSIIPSLCDLVAGEEPLRGVRAILRRTKSHKCARAEAIRSQGKPWHTFPDVIDLVPTLEGIYGEQYRLDLERRRAQGGLIE